MHKQGEKYIWYSRKNHDYSTTYGSDKSSGSMTPFIYDLFPDNVIDVILDGEMLAINITTSELLPFGSVKGASKSVLKGDSIIRPIFFVFDVLYLNGTILIDSTLEKRFQILSKIFKQRDNVLKILSHDVGYNKDDLVRLFDKRILSNEEGIIIKNPKSKYQIDARNNDWIKLKPEYFDQLGDTIDVAVIGVEWGTGRRAGMLTQLTVAIYDDTLDRMVPCGRVGSGLKDEEFRAFTDSVRDDFVTFDMKRLPKWITFPPNLKEKPALILKSIDRAPVIELSVSELVKSPGYGIAKFTFRFPRIKSIRTDKSSRDIITLTRFHALGDSNTGKMYNKTMNTSADSQPIKKRIVKGKVYSIGAENIGANIDGIEIESNLFSGYVFCLRFGNDEKEIEFKQDIQKTIHRFGGSFVENTSDSTNMVITNCGTDVSKITSQRVLNLIKIGKYDIVDVKWIQDCVDSNSIRILSKYLVYCTLETRKSLKQYSDRYGDSYTEDVTPESLKSFFDIIDGAKFDRYVEIETRDKIVPGTKIQKIRAELNDRYFNKVGFFERSIVYFDSGKILVDVDIFEEDYIDLVDDIVIFKDPVVPSLEHQLGILKVKSGGGLISSVLNNQVTHIVVFDDQRLKIFGAIKTRLKDRHTRSVKLITGKWLLNWEID